RGEPEAVGSVFAARRVPGSDRLMVAEVDGQGTVLVLEVGVEPAARAVDGEALGLAVEGEARLLGERARVEDADRAVARRGDPDLLRGGNVGQAVGHGVQPPAGAADKGARIDRADGGVAAVA